MKTRKQVEEVLCSSPRDDRAQVVAPGPTIAYQIGAALYLNITNRCTNRCTFCPKFSALSLKGHELRLDREPEALEVLEAIDRADAGAVYQEIVFCGFGESLLRLDLVQEVAAELKWRGLQVRVNTDGLGNLVYDRNILPEIAGLVDTVSVSLNAADATTYARLCNTPFGLAGFAGVCDFICEAVRRIPNVVASAVALPELDMGPVRNLAVTLGAKFRERPFLPV